MPTIVTRSMTSRIARLRELLDMLAPVPDSWLADKPKRGKHRSGGEMLCLECRDYRTLVNAWRKAMKWTEELDIALSVMLASVMSTKSVGDQLWVKIIGPPSCGKSTLCEALSVNPRYVLAKSTIRGFHSGWREGSEEEDNSLIAQVRNKTLVTKDGDTLLQSPNLGLILSEARDLYDSVSRSHYRNNMGKDYSGVRMTWILCGTSSLRQIDASELGARFLDYVIMEDINDELEDEILWRVANRVDRNMAMEADGTAQTHYEPELAEAMMLTGGYVDYLRENASEILSMVDNPDPMKRRCTRLGKFVAFMRARPSKTQSETDERELAPRLVSQHIRLAKCLAGVLNRKTVDEEVMKRVWKVSMDTARGQTLKIGDLLAARGRQDRKIRGLEQQSISLYTGIDPDKTKKLVGFLRNIGVLEIEDPEEAITRWVLTPKLQRLYEEVGR